MILTEGQEVILKSLRNSNYAKNFEGRLKSAAGGGRKVMHH
jgi:hypothetical protein